MGRAGVVVWNGHYTCRMDRGQIITTGGVDRPVRVEPSVRAVRVAAVVPCFNRPGDLQALFKDLERCVLTVGLTTAGAEIPSLRSGVVDAGVGFPSLRSGVVEAVRVELSVVVVDNASEPAIELPPLPAPIASRLVRLASNTGGSGGYNAGMAAALEDAPDYLWLVDSDARVEADTLVKLLAAMEADTSVVVAGPVLADTETGAVQEVGGLLDRKTGRFGAMATGVDDDGGAAVGCDYVAACCALVRAGVVRRVGLMPDVFLNADDVEWCLRLAGVGRGDSERDGGRDARPTGEHRVVVVPGARAAHPRFDRFGTLPRYFGARNAFGPIDALGLGWVVRFRRAVREVARAVNQHLMARPDIAALHIRGLRDAARGITRGMPGDLPRVEGMRPVVKLGAALRVGPSPSPAGAGRPSPRGRGGLLIDWPGDMAAGDRQVVRRALAAAGFDVDGAARAPTRSIAALVRRAITGPGHEVAVVPAKGSPAHWLVAGTMIELAPGGFVVRRAPRWVLMARCVGAVLAGGWYAARIGARRRRVSVLPAVDDARRLAPVSEASPAGSRHHGLSVVVLSYDRRDALLGTLARLRESPASRGAEIIVVDNASADGSAEAVRERAPWARVIALEANGAIAGFNRGVEAAGGELVLILDDDARPEPEALAGAVELLSRRADLGAVTLVPYHPETGEVEWPFAARGSGGRDARPTGLGMGGRDDWPVMGCCNLVRRDVWRAVGGYDESFFLYRNDVELALKILATGRGVHCNPAWRCEHDSPAAAQKSARWCRLATRNWVWMARRHGRGVRGAAGALAGWAWAHRLAGLSPVRQWNALRGGIDGFVRSPAALPASVRPDGRAFAALLRLRFGRR